MPVKRWTLSHDLGWRALPISSAFFDISQLMYCHSSSLGYFTPFILMCSQCFYKMKSKTTFSMIYLSKLLKQEFISQQSWIPEQLVHTFVHVWVLQDAIMFRKPESNGVWQTSCDSGMHFSKLLADSIEIGHYCHLVPIIFLFFYLQH